MLGEYKLSSRLCAKCFTWITSTPQQRCEVSTIIIPILRKRKQV